jgi:flagellar biosynthesis protein FlhF
MKFKKFVSPSMAQALKEIKRDLGPEALILHTRKVKRGGVAGVFAKQWVEVSAGVDEDQIQQSQPQAAVPNKEPRSRETLPGRASDESVRQNNRLTRDKVEISFKERTPGPQSTPREQTSSIEETLCKELVDNEVNSRLAARLASVAVKGCEKWELTIDNARNYLLEKMERLVKVSQPGVEAVNGPRIVALIGPTGVGKTTTIAKLAANYHVVHRLRVAMITIDMYRVGGAEQLRVYADLIQAPLSVVESPEQFRQALDQYNDYDMVLVDTAGRSQYNWMQILELAGFFKGINNLNIELVLSASTKYKDNIAAIERFSQVGVSHLIFSKIDETNEFGTLLNLSLGKKLPISYITTGQSVPDDIDTAEPWMLSRLIVNGREREEAPAGITTS